MVETVLSAPGATLQSALDALANLTPEAQLAEALRRLQGSRNAALARFETTSETDPRFDRLDGRLLEAICQRALAGSPGTIFTAGVESRILAAFGLAHAVAHRGGPPPEAALDMLLGLEPAHPDLSRSLSGLSILDPACGGGALLSAAARLARGCGAEVVLHGIDIAPLAAKACAGRLALLGQRASITPADAFGTAWPEVDLVLANPPFVRHEVIPSMQKGRAAEQSGLSLQADLSAHFAALAIQRAPVVALVWPQALFTSRSSSPLLSLARARGGFVLSLRSQVAGSFTASVDTSLVVWRKGAQGRAPAEAAVALSALSDGELAGLERGVSTRRLRPLRPAAPAPKGAVTVGQVTRVCFGVKSGCNGFFHLRPLGARRFSSALAGEIDLAPRDVVPLLATLKEARAPNWLVPARVLFRPDGLSASARRHIAMGESLGVHLRPTCAGREPWWRLAPGRPPAPVLYPAKVGARAFAVLNSGGLYEDKKWHALFPHEIEPWLLALVLSTTPVRLAVERSARQLTGAQAIADIDCRVLAAAVFPAPAALKPLMQELHTCWQSLARDPVTTDLVAMQGRSAQRELDALTGRALGLSSRIVDVQRRQLAERISARLEQATQIRSRVASEGTVLGRTNG